MAVAVAVAVAVSGGGAVAVAGLTKRFFNHIQKDFLINDLNQDVRISIFNVIRTKMLLSRARVTVPCKQSLLPKIIVDFNQSAFL